jgi:hypothetical protein
MCGARLMTRSLDVKMVYGVPILGGAIISRIKVLGEKLSVLWDFIKHYKRENNY